MEHHHPEADEQAHGHQDNAPQGKAGQDQAGQHSQQNQGDQVGGGNPVGPFHRPHDNYQVEGQQEYRGPAVGRAGVIPEANRGSG